MSAKYTFLAWDTPVKDSSTKLALLQLANNADDNGFSYYSISKMSKACDMSDRTFMRKIQNLEKMNILTVERRSNRPSLYTLIGDEMGVTICQLQTTEVTDCHAEVTDCHGVGDNLSLVPNNTPNTTPESIINKEIENEFNYFWANGLNNGSKKKALESFTKIVKKTKECPKEFSGKLVLDCIARKKANHFGFENLHATTYLNQERWTDKIQVNQSVQPRFANQQPQIDNNDTSWMNNKTFEDKYCEKG